MKKSKIKLFTAIILCLLMAGCKIAANNGDKNQSDPTNVTTPSDTDDSEDSEDPVTPEDPDTPENPETPEETVSLCGVNWEVINDQINGAYYFDENGTYYGYSTILAANKTTYARGTYEILPGNKMNLTLEELCFAKEPVSVFEILINEDFEMPEGNFQWMPYTQEDPTEEIDYNLNNDKLTLSMGEMIYELSLASVQPTDLSGKNYV